MQNWTGPCDMSSMAKKQIFGVSDQVRHKPGCITTEDGYELDILDLGSRGIVLCSENIGAHQLCCDLRFCLHICEKQAFS